jgi:hypothetical protein
MLRPSNLAVKAVVAGMLSFCATIAVCATTTAPLWPQSCLACFNAGPDGTSPNPEACELCCENEVDCINKDGCTDCCWAYNWGFPVPPLPEHCRRNP